ncbi:MAG: BolA family transcriptional regulator [Deltaproteobacteria bacterium]|nr:BolA family transcriptional regulator [Deltaproteobacteria bacterium]MBI3387574.1 BolA family transcriptional regulator [Deltaproteobacteria bacterium]
MDMMETIDHALRERLHAQQIEIIDDSRKHAGHAGAGSGGHYTVTVISADFAGKSALERHRMVYAALGDLMQRGIHALALTTRAPGEAG